MSTIKSSTISVYPRLSGEIPASEGCNLHVLFSEIDTTKETLLFLHGYIGSSQDYSAFINLLKDDYNIIAVNLRGHGGSEAPLDYNWKIDDFAYDIWQILDILLPEGIKVDIIASSISTAIALQLAKTYPDLVNKLFLISATDKFDVPSYAKIVFEIGKLAPSKFASSLMSLIDIFMALLFEDDENPLEGFRRFKAINFEAHKKILLETINWEIDVSNIKNKTLIIAGTADKIIPYEDSKRLNELLPNSTLLTIENSKHRILQRENELVLEILMDWLSCSDILLENSYYTCNYFIDEISSIKEDKRELVDESIK